MNSRRFDWHDAKAEINARKHRVTFEEAATVFNDPRRLQMYDLEHSVDQDRGIVIGFSHRMRLLMVVIYEQGENISRIISARRKTKDSVTLPKVSYRNVEFTPEEMAMDCPMDTSDPDTYPTITRGDKDWKKFISFRNGFVRLSPELRKMFPNNRSVNNALEAFLQTRGEKK